MAFNFALSVIQNPELLCDGTSNFMSVTASYWARTNFPHWMSAEFRGCKNVLQFLSISAHNLIWTNMVF